MWQEYRVAASIEEALDLLGRYQGEARLIAGGTDLVLQCQRGECPARVLVDVTRIPGLDRVEERGGWVYLGAAVTHAQAAASSLVRRWGQLLARACGMIGGPQVRNMGTLVGNIVTALPAADATLALTALDAEAEVASPQGRRWLPMQELHRDVGVCLVNPCVEMITQLRFRALGPEYGCAHQRIARRKEHALPILNVGVVAALQDGRWHDVRIAIGPVAVKPLRVRSAEEMLEGQPAAAEAMRRAGELTATMCQPRDSLLRGSREYRLGLAAVFVRRALEAISDQLSATSH